MVDENLLVLTKPVLFLSFHSVFVLTFWLVFVSPVPSPDPPVFRNLQSQESQEEFDSLFNSVAEEQVPSPKEDAPPPLSDNDLAVFDPCFKQGENKCGQTRFQFSQLSLNYETSSGLFLQI